MDSLLNAGRPAVFCPGCSHDQVLRALDKTLIEMGYGGQDVAIVTDIGCSGLFDTFFNTHAFHGLHGRALTYATGIKMARPGLKVIVTMGDGGLGIGGAHVLSTCRRNIDLTLLVLNNFNYGMTGGQCSSTTPQDAVVGSGFLNKLEKPVDICQVAGAAGAPWVARASTYQKDIGDMLKAAIAFDGFSLVDIWGICPGRYTRRNKLTPKIIDADLARMPNLADYQALNARPEYGQAYRQEAAGLDKPKDPVRISATCKAPGAGRQEIVILGSAGQRIITAGELLCLAGASAGCHATQKNDYPITVMKGHSVSEVIVSDSPIEYTGIEDPGVVIALAPEGINRRKKMLAALSPEGTVVKAAGVELPETRASVLDIDFKSKKIKSTDWALAALAVLAGRSTALTMEMLTAALKLRFNPKVFEMAQAVIQKMTA
ncbi:MAG: thiamine pyrophosphate-dependent enzyme [Desulfobacteraceae bacterium]|jgi:pyruvate/2-oxoacid:ferredoxin oxidoreductase beta subunit/Pyruvate/2-oxoacid:ferredoxin oxidoreductase gamma subunit